MDHESDSNFTEESNYSLMSDLPNNSMRKLSNNQNQRNRNYNFIQQNVSNNPEFSRGNEKHETDRQQMSDADMQEYIMNLFEYVARSHPTLVSYFGPLNGELDNDTGRETPLKFMDNHAICKLDFPGLKYQLDAFTQEGGMITITDDIYFDSIELQSDEYPGPLTMEKAIDEQICSYLKDQMSVELQDTAPIDWDSGQLLINYLLLLINDRGKPIISNIVRLLISGVEVKTADLRKESKINFDTISRNSFSRTSSRATSRASSRPVSPNTLDTIDIDLPPQNSVETPQGPGSVTSIIHRAAINVNSEQSLCKHMDKYRQKILCGFYDDAVRYATKSGIWDHAFALALRINKPQLTNEVLVSFSRRAISSNDPLFTMHELLARKPPKIVAANHGFTTNEMGDWRCHLGMILAMKKFRPDDCRQAIESLGEKLFALRNYFGAHLCYLLAETPFGLDKASIKYRRKFDLIGWQSSTSSIPIQKSTLANCRKLFTGLKYWNTAPEQCIKLTEVFEYALKLCTENTSSAKSLSIHLLPYKYLMAYRMLSRNQVLNAFEYCMNIGEILGYNVKWTECESINFHIISNIRDLSYRLESLLTSSEDSVYINSDKKWLSNITNVYGMFCDKYKFWNPNTSPKPDFTETLYNNTDQSFSHSQTGNFISSEYESNEYNYAESIDSSVYTDNLHHQPGANYRSMNRPNTATKTGFQNGTDLINTGMYQRSQEQFNSVTQMKPQESIGFGQREFMLNRDPTFQHDYLTSQQKEFSGSNFLASTNLAPTQSFNNTTRPPEQMFPLKTAPQYNLKLMPENSAFHEISPPSELPNEAIMTQPPKFTEMKHTTNSIVNRNIASNGVQGLKYETQEHEPILPNKWQNQFNESINPHKSMYNQTIPNQISDVILNQNSRNEMSKDEYHSEEQFKLNMYLHNAYAAGTNKSTFMPTVNSMNDTEENSEADCFANIPQTSRSRSQSNGSVGSLADHQKQSPAYLSRSRNSSESKDNVSHPSNQLSNNPRTLETTKEETTNVSSDKSKPKPEQSESTQSNWSFFKYLPALSLNKSKEIHLPKDTDKQFVWDETRKIWHDKSNPESEKPISPPPPNLPSMENFNISSPDAYHTKASTQLTKSRYKPPTMNVKPSVPPSSNPILNIAPNMDFSPNRSQHQNEGYTQFSDRNSMMYGSYTGDINPQVNYNDQFRMNQSNLLQSSSPLSSSSINSKIH